MEKLSKYTFRGINRDASKSKNEATFYYDAQHIRITASTDKTGGSITNEKGNKMVIKIPEVTINQNTSEILYNNSKGDIVKIYFKKSFSNLNNSQYEIPLFGNVSFESEIIGAVSTNESIVIFTTSPQGIDCIWEIINIGANIDIKLLYLNKLEFSKSNPIQAIFNYENEKIQKVFWVDGKNQIRYINIKYDSLGHKNNLIDLHSTSINFVGDFTLKEPKILEISSGGSQEAGMVQYAYNLFNANGSESKLSPLTELIPLTNGKGLGGAKVGELVGESPLIRIDDIDRRYSHIKVYSIKYTSLNELPSINIIDEREINSESLTLLDTGKSIDSVPLESFLFLGGEPLIPKHIETKDNNLLPVNVQTREFVIPDELDCRAYSFLINSNTSRVIDEVTGFTIEAQGVGKITVNNFTVPEKHSSININYDEYRYQPNSSILGGEGKYIKYSLNPITNIELNTLLLGNYKDVGDIKFFKDDEIYRIGIQFYNKLGQISTPKWIADFKAPSGNLNRNFHYLKVELKQEFYDFIESYNWRHKDDKIIGYKILRAERTMADRTIVYQGILSNMVFQVKNRSDGSIAGEAHLYEDTSVKVPTYAIRHFVNYPNVRINCMNYTNFTGHYPYAGGILLKNNHRTSLPIEVYLAKPLDNKTQYSWIHDKMLQMYSPELIFNDPINLPSGLRLRVKGYVELDKAAAWYQEVFTSTNIQKNGGKVKGVLNPWSIPFAVADPYLTEEMEIIESTGENQGIFSAAETPLNRRACEGEDGYMGWYGFINPPGTKDTMTKKMFYRKYQRYVDSPNKLKVRVYNKPEFSQKGTGEKIYANDARYRYKNNLSGIMSDVSQNNDSVISSVDSEGTNCLTMVLGDKGTPTINRYGLSELYRDSGLEGMFPITTGHGLMICEVVFEDSSIYMKGIYGGNTYENKRRTTYLEIGNYSDIENSEMVIYSPGDTFVDNFKLLRLSRPDTEQLDTSILQISELIEYPTETSVDLKNRNDLSLNEWDAVFNPKHEDYNKYNKVYSQGSNLVINKDIDYKFQRVRNYENRLYSSLVKVPGEIIDSWTNIPPNDFIDLDGKYGPINGISVFRNKVFTFQDNAIANIEINPRVAIKDSEGQSVHLGSGTKLYGFNYLTTESGSMNKWSIASGKRGVYYYDLLNKSFNRIPDNLEVSLSDKAAVHTLFENNYNYNNLKVDNPLVGRGVVAGVDPIKGDVFLTLHQDSLLIEEGNLGHPNTGEKISFTMVYNELVDQVIDFKKYLPKFYINGRDKLFALENLTDIYEQYAGKYNNFFGKHYPSYVTIMVNPESDVEKVFTNILFNSEVYLDDIDQPDKTLSHISAWNEYQDTGKIPLIVGRKGNIRRRFREWKAEIPREGRNRIRNPWIFLKLEFDHTYEEGSFSAENNYKFVLHDIIVKYMI